MATKKMIEINHLSKNFGTIKAVDNLSFYVEPGALFAFLGVNGAGKSTTISMLCGQLAPDCGEIFVDENPVTGSNYKVKKTIGVVFQDSVLDKPLTGKENLESRAALYGIYGDAFLNRLKELIDLFDMSEFIDRPVGKLSGGQRRRIDIARALIHSPQLLILDEPTTGLDPQTRKMIWQIVKKLREEEKMTVLLTTHYMEEAADAEYVIIIDHGSIVAKGTPYDLKTKFVRDSLLLYGVTDEEIKKIGMPHEKIANGYKIPIPSPLIATDLIGKWPEIFRDYEIIKGRMDDVFLTVTGKQLGGDQ